MAQKRDTWGWCFYPLWYFQESIHANTFTWLILRVTLIHNRISHRLSLYLLKLTTSFQPENLSQFFEGQFFLTDSTSSTSSGELVPQLYNLLRWHLKVDQNIDTLVNGYLNHNPVRCLSIQNNFQNLLFLWDSNWRKVVKDLQWFTNQISYPIYENSGLVLVNCSFWWVSSFHSF